MAWDQYDARRRRPRPSSREQERFQRAVLERASFRCEIRGPQCITQATIGDHITPWAEGGSNDLSNGQAACKPCHDQKTQAEATRGRNRWKRTSARHPGMDQI